MEKNVIFNKLSSGEPCMIARFGSIEIKGIIYGKYPYLLWPLKYVIFKKLRRNAGFFSCDEKEIKKFSTLMLSDIKCLDILGSWRKEEFFFKKQLKTIKKIELHKLEPYFNEIPWSKYLENKKVLVIHPFSELIQYQYINNRSNLFENPNVLPKFKSLETIKAVQTIAGESSRFKNWFEALEYMKNEIDKKDFEIAIIGCGAYGFPLAAYIKRIGKQAVHLGGATQILFGIKGKRWENNSKFDNIINEYFVKPSFKDIPKNSKSIEDGCYW